MIPFLAERLRSFAADLTTLVGRLTSTRATNLDNLDATVSSRATNTDMTTLLNRVTAARMNEVLSGRYAALGFEENTLQPPLRKTNVTLNTQYSLYKSNVYMPDTSHIVCGKIRVTNGLSVSSTISVYVKINGGAAVLLGNTGSLASNAVKDLAIRIIPNLADQVITLEIVLASSVSNAGYIGLAGVQLSTAMTPDGDATGGVF